MNKIVFFIYLISLSVFSQKDFIISVPIQSQINKLSVVSGPAGHVIWESGDLSQVNHNVLQEVFKQLRADKRFKSIYNQVGARSWDLNIELDYPYADNTKDLTFHLLSYIDLGSGRWIDQGEIKRSRKIYNLNQINSIQKLRIIAKSKRLETTKVSLKINDIKVAGNIPIKVTKNSNYCPKINSPNWQKPKSTVYCGIPKDLIGNEWERINQKLNLISDYCNLIRNLNLIKEFSALTPGVDSRAIPEKPELIKPPEFLKNISSKPIRNILSKSDLPEIMAGEYNQLAVMDLRNAFRTNSAYLIDVSPSVNKQLAFDLSSLITIKTEVNLQLELVKERYISAYRMSFKGGKKNNILFENFRGKKLEPKKFKEYQKLINQLEPEHITECEDTDDRVLNAFNYAVENKLVDTINILSDGVFEEFSLGKQDQLLKKMELKIKNANRPLTINVVNYRLRPLHYSYENYLKRIVKLGTGKGVLISSVEKMVPRYTRNILRRIANINKPEMGDRILEGYQKMEDEKYSKELIAWEEKRNEVNTKHQISIAKYEAYLKDMDAWEQEYKTWRKADQENKLTHKAYLSFQQNQIKFVSDQSIIQAIEEFIQSAESENEASFFELFREFMLRP